MNDDAVPRSVAAKPLLCLIAVLLCLCSIVQLELATTAAQQSMKMVAKAKAEPPIMVKLVLPLWITVSRGPWELALCLAYAVLVVMALRRNFQRFAVLIVVLWLACNVSFFVLIWLASLPYKTCCI